MKKKNPLGLRVLSTAAIMSIVSSIAAPAFADIYYIGNGSIDIVAKTDENGKEYVEVKQDGKTYNDYSDEIVLKDGTSEDDATLKEVKRAEDKRSEDANKKQTAAETTIGETEETPVEEEPEEEEPVEEVEEETPAEEPEAEPEEVAEEQPEETEEEPEEAAEDEQPEEPAAEEETPAEETEEPEAEEPAAEETVEETDTEETPEKAEETEEETEEEPEAEETTEETAEAEETEEAAEQPAEAADEGETAPAEPEAATEIVTQEAAAQEDAVAQDETETPAKGSENNPTNNVIRIINNWVKGVLNIRLSNVNIKADTNHSEDYGTSGSGYSSAMAVEGQGDTKIELDGKSSLDSSGVWGTAGLRKQGTGTMTITNETDDAGQTITEKDFDKDTSGSLTAKGGFGNGGAGIGGSVNQGTENITIEGFATVDATGGNGAGIGGGGAGASSSDRGGDAKNIIIQGNAHVDAKATYGAGIGGGSAYSSSRAGGAATGILIRDHATVSAESESGAGIGSAGYTGSNDADVTIGTAGADSTTEDVHVTAKSKYGAAIGGGNGQSQTTTVTIQGHATIDEATSEDGTAIGGNSGKNVTVTIKDNAVVKKAQQTGNQANYSAIGGRGADEVIVNIEGNAYLKELFGSIGAGFGVKDTIINIKDNAKIGTIKVDTNYAIGGPTSDTQNVTVNIDGGPNGNVQIGTEGGIGGGQGSINGTVVTIGDHVLMKLKQISDTYRRFNNNYLCENKTEAEVGSALKPEEGGLINTIGDNTEIWYTDFSNKLVKIVHGKNVCVWDDGTVTEQPTCNKPGKKVYHCIYEKSNGATKTSCDRTWEEEIPATDEHTWDNGTVTKEATCTEKGEKTFTCKDCGKTKTEEIPVDPNNHDYSGEEWDEITNATCTKDGLKVKHCNRPGVDATHDKTEVIPATGHEYGEWKTVTKATCTAQGEEKRTCSECGDVQTRKTDIDPNAHDYQDDWTVTTKPGCTTKGEETRHCHNNPEHTETRDVAPTGHQHTEIVGKKDPTETEPGYTGDKKCIGCGETIEKGEEIPATGKNDDDNAEAPELRVVVTGNTLRDLLFTVRQADGERTYTCKKADATLTGTLETLQYLQANGTETIVFVTNGRVSRFAVADLLALCNEGDVFYLCHTADAEPTLLIIANDHTELLNK